VGYGTSARRVRDDSLPLGVRVASFKSCLERYHPIGYEASLGYLKVSAGPFDRDADALLRALGLLTASRDLWLAAQAAYAQSRRAGKRCGRRTPAKNEPPPGGNWRWAGAERAAALFALEYEYHRRETGDLGLGPLVERTLTARGVLDAADLTLLDRLRAEVDHFRTRGFDWEKPDWPRWHRSSDALRLLAHVHNAAYARD
jgi:hypothetical protein